MRYCALMLTIFLVASISTSSISTMSLEDPDGVGSVNENATTPSPSASLDLDGDFSKGTTVNGTWASYLSSDLSESSNLLNDSDLRLDEQIDLHLGDNDSNLSQTEWDAFVDLIVQQNMTSLNGRVWLDDNSFSSESGMESL